MTPRALVLRDRADIMREFGRIGVDWGGRLIMRSKAFLRLLKIEEVPTFCANILKQEMLSVGGDAALSRDSITGSARKTDCLLLGTVAQHEQLISKLKKQPFGLEMLGCRIKSTLADFESSGHVLRLGTRRVRLGRRTRVMGIINATPDSFSQDGLAGRDFKDAFVYAQRLADEGADILDIGGESSRPGARRISAKEEIRRVLPWVKACASELSVPLSIDTTKADVAAAALDHGAVMVNDISALRGDRRMAKLVARRRAALVLVHMKGTPRSMQNAPRYEDVMGEIFGFLGDAIKKALDSGVQEDKIIIDPGIGFGKTLEHNLEILRRLAELRCLGRPVLVGASRKRFIGALLDAEPHQRTWGTAAAISAAVVGGADIVRVHDVFQMKQVVTVSDAIHKR